MTSRLQEFVKFRGDRLFNGAVSINWFGTDEDKSRAAAEAYLFHGPQYHGVSQADVGTSHGHRLQDTASFARSIVRRCYGLEDQPFTLAIAGYGTGKSHIGLTLANLLSSPKAEVADTILASIEAADREIGNDVRATLNENDQPCLVIALNGMQNFDLTAEVTRQVIRNLKAAGLDTTSLDKLRPRFLQAASLIRMSSMDVLKDLLAHCEAADASILLVGMEQQDETIYAKVHAFFSSRGMPITALGGESVDDVIKVATREYCGRNKPYRSLVFLFDEFGRYTEFATVRSQVAGSGVLQELFEGVQASGGLAIFVGFIQFELNAYVERVASEYKNDILRYVTRYQTAQRAYLSINLETLIAHLFDKSRPQDLIRWFDTEEQTRESQEIVGNLGRWYPQSKTHRLWSDASEFHVIIRKGCWPLSPFSTWLLFYLAAAGKHLQERSALALVGDVFERFRTTPIPENGSWSLAPVDLWSDSLQQDLISSEDGGQQGSITNAYASVMSRHSVRLGEELGRILKAVVLASKMGLQAGDKDDAIEALAELAGINLGVTDKGVRLLQDEYNVLEWDEAFKAFDILGDAVPRTQFLSFVRRRVASSYDEAGKARLFASKGALWCDLLGDQDCDFAEENKITTREWRYRGVTSNLDLLQMQLKLASDRWIGAVGVDEPRGSIIYCYVEPNRDAAIVAKDCAKLLRAAFRDTGATALPVLVVLLCDEDGAMGQALAELAVLEESLSEEDRVRFGNLVGAHREKMRQVIRSHVDRMIKQRQYATCFAEALEAQRLIRAGTELFGRIYKSPLSFPFDGFSTAKGNAADTCQELTGELLLGKLDYGTVIAKPAKAKNRAIGVLKDTWGIFSQNGDLLRRPRHPVVRAISERWDNALATDSKRLSVGDALRQLCQPPHGANIASAGLMLGVFVAPRAEQLIVIRDGQQFTMSQWLQDQNGVFKGKFIDLEAVQAVELILAGEGSSEWETLLDEWDQAESYLARVQCLERAKEIKARIPVPPALGYREMRLAEHGEIARHALAQMDGAENDAIDKLESGYERNEIGLLGWGAAMLLELGEKMVAEAPRWTDQQVEATRTHMERARQTIVQSFPAWVGRQSPNGDTPDAIGNFKHKMIRLVGGNLKKLGLESLFTELEVHTNQVVKNADSAAEARQLIRDVHSWLQSHGDAARVIRVAENRALREVGKEYASKLQGLSERVKLAEIGELRTQLASFMTVLKDGEADTLKRTKQLWQSRLLAADDLDRLLESVEALTNAFENCPSDLEDLHLMRLALRMYQKDLSQLEDERLTWAEFEKLAEKLQKEGESTLGDNEVPWPPDETIAEFVEIISKRRKQASLAWIEDLEGVAGSVSSMSAVDANRIHTRASSAPSILTEPHAKRQQKVLREIETRLDALKIEWLVEKFKELSPALQKKFLKLVAEKED